MSAEESADSLNQGSDSLFQGMQFWLSQNIPQRSRFKELITVRRLALHVFGD